MRKLYFFLALALLCGAVAAPILAAAPAAAAQAPAETTVTSPEAPAPDGMPPAATPAAAPQIFCAFTCDDGTGLAYGCWESTFGACCQIGHNGCALYGGTDTGTCWKGNLGVSCVPL